MSFQTLMNQVVPIYNTFLMDMSRTERESIKASYAYCRLMSFRKKKGARARNRAKYWANEFVRFVTAGVLRYLMLKKS